MALVSLTPVQKTALEHMRSNFSDVYVSSQPGPVANVYTFLVDDECLLRYLRARNFDVEKASAMLRNTLAWRKSYGVDHMLSDWRGKMEIENATGKLFVKGFDKEGHALLHMKPSLENTNDFEGNMKHLAFNLEVAIASMKREGKGVEKLILLVDFENWTLLNAPPLKTSKETLNILQNHYPERLFKAIAVHPPLIFSVFWTAVSPFIDPTTKAKILMLKQNPEAVKAVLTDLIDPDVLETKYGGNDASPFDSATYLNSVFGPLNNSM